MLAITLTKPICSLTFDFDFAIVCDNFFVPWRYDGTAHRHLLDLNANWDEWLDD
jgi:hypothetical protein